MRLVHSRMMNIVFCVVPNAVIIIIAPPSVSLHPLSGRNDRVFGQIASVLKRIWNVICCVFLFWRSVQGRGMCQSQWMIFGVKWFALWGRRSEIPGMRIVFVCNVCCCGLWRIAWQWSVTEWQWCGIALRFANHGFCMVSVAVERNVSRSVTVLRRVGISHMFGVCALRLYLWPIFLWSPGVQEVAWISWWRWI